MTGNINSLEEKLADYLVGTLLHSLTYNGSFYVGTHTNTHKTHTFDNSKFTFPSLTKVAMGNLQVQGFFSHNQTPATAAVLS